MTTYQVQCEGLCGLTTKNGLQQLLGHDTQHQQGHQGHRNAEAQQGEEAALTARPSVSTAGQPVGAESGLVFFIAEALCTAAR